MKHVDRFTEFYDVEDAVFGPRVDPNFEDAGSNAWHGFPIGWLQSLLNKPKMVPRNASRIFRKRFYVVERGSRPYDRFPGHSAVYKYLYTTSIIA